jgi:malonyl-CoA/methylmalonyl-CoA synthetase
VNDNASPAWARHLPPGQAWEDINLTRRVSLPAAWAQQWRANPNRAILRDPDGTWISARELLERTAEVAARFAAAGLRSGDRILISGDSSNDFVVAYCAALRAGLVVVPVNSGYSRRELEVILQDSSPSAAVLERPEHRAAASSFASDIVVTGIKVDLPGGRTPVLDAAASAHPALLPYTSGTTGKPKGTVLSHGNLLASVEAVRIAWRWGRNDRLILCLPLFHMHGLGVGLNGTLLVGGSAILQRGFEAEAVLRAAADDATMFFGVPTMYSRLSNAAGAERLGVLRLCVSGSAPLSADLHRQIETRCRQRVIERYGMTETLMLVSNPFDGERRPGTVGFPLPGVSVRLNVKGEILVKGPNVFSGYLGLPEANSEAFTEDGEFRTGDIGAFDADGYLSIVGRAKELIISGGFNVYPREIEDVLRGHPSVVDAAVVGTPSEEWGEVVTAYVEANDGFDSDALLQWVAGEVASYKKPRVVYRIDALPRNSLGKVLRDKLRPPS